MRYWRAAATGGCEPETCMYEGEQERLKGWDKIHHSLVIHSSQR